MEQVDLQQKFYCKILVRTLHPAPKTSPQNTSYGSREPLNPQPSSSSQTTGNFRGLKCHKCGSIQHLWREYPQHQPPGETIGRLRKLSSSTTSSTVTSVSKTGESEAN